jgi:imidazole glycerol-phosphate synthase subunit HisF
VTGNQAAPRAASARPANIPRVIPCLLIDDEAMVKTIRFADPTYLGDPINVINLFNRFEVDEITLLDIGATRDGYGPPFALLEQLAAECWVPLSYGGGIARLDHVRRVLACGIEKVVLGTVVADDPTLVTRAAEVYGSQAVIVAVDALRRGDGYEAAVTNAKRRLGVDPVTYARRAQELGAGEILLNAVDRDGTMEGYDLELIRAVAGAVEVPVIACGGAGERGHLVEAIRQGGASAVAAGSIFVYRGRERGVLINFPERELLEAMLG